MDMIPLYKPFMPAELPEIDTILHSGALSYGKWGNLFEKELGEFIGNNNIIVVNSFNSAMLVAITTIGIKPGDEIIASPMSCLASNQPLVTQGAKVIWADIDPSTGTLSPLSVRSKITNKTKAILHNHYCGYIGYIDEINEIGRELGILVIDDAIEAFGSEYKGRRIGNVGTDITIFSFQTVRIPNTIDGGAIIFKNNDLFQKAVLTRDYGIDRIHFRDNLGEISKNYNITNPGFGATLSEINSYIGCQQMRYIDHLLEVQRINGLKWKEYFEIAYPEFEIVGKNMDILPNYWIFGVLTELKQQMMLSFRKMGYYASGVHLPNNYYSVFGKKDILPGIDEFYSKFIALPSGWWI
jgi:dTDP-4-amino-4,6-dideoxygalactose transaminase